MANHYEHRRGRPEFPPSAILAMPPEAFGEEFDIFFFGGETPVAFEVCGKYAVVTIKGPLEQAKSWRLDSYAAVKTRAAAAFASDSPEVCLRISSPGGSFAGCLELARELRAMATEAKKPLSAFVDSQALSAGYALACSSTKEIAITPSAAVGSVGVWSALVDATAQDAARGLKVEIVASDDHKADRNPHVPMTAEAIERLRAEVTDMAEMFREEVAEGRGMRPSSLRKLKGASVFGAAAVKAKLADRLVDSWEKFVGSSTANDNIRNEEEMSLYSKAAMQAAAEKGDREAAEMLALLAKAEEPDEDDKEMKSKKAKKAKAEEDEADAKKAKAKEDAPIKKGDEKDEKDAKALSDVISRVQAMEAAAEAKEAQALENNKRAALLAERPDFSDAVLEVLAMAPIAALEKAVKDFPKSTFRNPATAALQAHGIAGEKAGDLHLALDAETAALLDRKMPMGGNRQAVAFTVGCGDPDAARKFLAAQDAARKAG